MDESEAEALLEQVLTAKEIEERRAAFLKLVGSDHWRLVLAPHVISRQCTADGTPDLPVFHEAAPLIAREEERIHRVLELAGSRCAEEMLRALARHMGRTFVEHGLDHLRTAEGERATLLEEVLHDADPFWVRERGARRAIRNRLRTEDVSRVPLMVWLADARNLIEFIDEIREYPPRYLEEWSALGRTGANEEGFINRALSRLGGGPEPLAYRFRLDPLPEGILQRTLSAAKPEWLLAALEVAITEGLESRKLVPLVELAARLGGRHLAAAVAWLNLAKLGPELLTSLAEQLRAAGGERRLSGLFWVQRRPPSANRALEHGRRDEDPDPMDAAALVRQLQGNRMLELVREILEKPRPTMVESVLRPLCAVNPEAAEEVMALGKNVNPELAERAKAALEWPDVMWPEEEPEPEKPATFTPLGEGI